MNFPNSLKSLKTAVAFVVTGGTFVLSLAATGCAPNLGATIEAAPIPVSSAADSRNSARARFGSVISIIDVRDARPPLNEGDDTRYTEPHGGIPQIVENAVKDALSNAGIAVVGSAPIEMKIEVVKWRSNVLPKGNVQLKSEATLNIELVDPSGKKVFSGSYNGVRSSQFPVVTRVDVKDSLGLAMANALEQLTSDAQFLELVGSF